MMQSAKIVRCSKMQNWVYGLILKLYVSSFQNLLNCVSMTFTSFQSYDYILGVLGTLYARGGDLNFFLMGMCHTGFQK